MPKDGKRRSSLPPEFVATVKRQQRKREQARARAAGATLSGPAGDRLTLDQTEDGNMCRATGLTTQPPQRVSQTPPSHPPSAANVAEDSRPLERRVQAVPAANFYGRGARNFIDGFAPMAHRREMFAKRLFERLRAALLHYRRKNVFREFALQREAFAFADSLALDAGADEARVFARELDKTGKRRFFVASYEECWRRLMRTGRNCRHFYEVVREGWPCYLYFDIEFSKELNPDTDGDSAMAAFLDFLPRGLRRLYPLHDLRFRPGDVIDLDSSTDKKFSRHVIVRPNAAHVVFADNVHMGACVRQLVDLVHAEARALATDGRHNRVREIFVRTSAEEHPPETGHLSGDSTGAAGMGLKGRQPFIDMGVYTKNRCFRTPFSSKFGRTVVLDNASGSESTIELHGNEEELFYNSLVCRLAHAPHHMTTLLDPSLPPPVAAPVLGKAQDSQGQLALCGGKPNAAHVTVETYGSQGRWAEHVPGAGQDSVAWKAIGDHVMSLWNSRAGHERGRIRSAAWMDGAGGHGRGGREGSQEVCRVVSFRIDGNRWCDRIGREHKSNGITLHVDTVKGCFYQRCFDPDCRAARARSNEFPLPDRLLEALRQPASPSLTTAGQMAVSAVEKEEDDEWNEEVLASIDDFLRQRGLQVEEEVWSEDVMTSIHSMLQCRRSAPDPSDQASAEKGTNLVSGSEQQVWGADSDEWSDELLASIDASLSARDAGGSESEGRPSGVVVETDDSSFDEECIRACEAAEREFNSSRAMAPCKEQDIRAV